MIRTRQKVVAEFTGLSDSLTPDQISVIAQVVIDDYVSGQVDAVYLGYSKFNSTLSQTPVVVQLLPIVPQAGSGEYNEYIFEPTGREVLTDLLPRLVEVQIYQAILENFASEYSARMVAMRNASDNARDLVSDLTLSYNKARQAQITSEVSEIAAGANAMRQQG
jgi:F-type H+-transporting ATPase subunit gamma